MQKVITKYGLAAHLALVAVAPLFLSSSAVFCLAALAFVWMLLEPSRIHSERLHEARRRVFRSLAADPLSWVLLLVFVLTGLRAANGGISMAYDAEAVRWTISEPIFPNFPGCAEGQGLDAFAAVAALCVVVAGCRHAVGKRARHAFFLLSSALTGLGALVLYVKLVTGDAALRSLAECTLLKPAYLGSAFGVYLVGSVVAIAAVFENHWLRAFPLLGPAVLGNLLGLFVFSPSFVALGYGAVAVLTLVYDVIRISRKQSKASGLKALLSFAFLAAAAVFVLQFSFPDTLLSARLEPFETGAFFDEAYWSVRGVLSRIAFASWLEHPWIGSGIGAFPFELAFRATEADWLVVSPEQTASVFGYWQLLVERGVIGAALVAGPALLMLITYVRRLVRGIRFGLPQPAAIAGLLVVVAAGVEAVFDAAFLLPGLMTALGAFFALAASSFPKER